MQTKIEALQLIAAIVRGLGDRDRNTASIQADALKAAVRAAKEAADSETCLAAAGVASAKISVLGLLWNCRKCSCHFGQCWQFIPSLYSMPTAVLF